MSKANEAVCPKCGDALRERDEFFPDCETCGYTQYDARMLALIAEVQREQAAAKRILGYVPSYTEAIQKGLVRQ